MSVTRGVWIVTTVRIFCDEYPRGYDVKNIVVDSLGTEGIAYMAGMEVRVDRPAGSTYPFSPTDANLGPEIYRKLTS